MTKSDPGKVIAFYSFKGGTGRTMALANVGCTLAQDSKLAGPVLLIDWDLEAPGLHRYFRKHLNHAFNGDEGLLDSVSGLIDLFINIRDGITRVHGPEQDYDAASALIGECPLADYIIKTDIPRLHLMKAGRFDKNYAASISSFQWLELYRRSPYLLRAFAERLARDYSYVIIDSRTGLTDTSGICTMLMPEILVTVFTPNRQSLSGVIDLISEAARYRAKSDDLRPLVVYPLPSRIEASEPALRQSWRHGDHAAGVPSFQRAFEECFKEIYALPACDLNSYFDDVQIQHVPSYAYGEEIAVLVEETSDRFSLTQSYLRFTARLTKGDPPWTTVAPKEVSAADDALLKRPTSLAAGWRWYISYNDRDFAQFERVISAIRRVDPSHNTSFASGSMRAGGFWLPQLAKEIAEANAFVLLVGENGFGPWQTVEYFEALDRSVRQPNFRIILILLEGQSAPGLPFLGRLPWIVTPDPGSEKSVSQLIAATAAEAGAFGRELWRHTRPYRGLEAMTEADSDFFFGRGRETQEAIEGLTATPDKILILIGNSGVGKTSIAQAGVIGALMRQDWPEAVAATRSWPSSVANSRQWCCLKFRPGTEPVRALVASFMQVWQYDATDPGLNRRTIEWIENFTNGRLSLRDLLDATEARLKEQDRFVPPAYLIYIDQGEELYVRAEEHQRRRFSELIAHGLADPRLRVMMSMRADFLGELQKDEALYSVHRLINVPPMREAELREVVTRPAQILSAKFESENLAADIAQRAAEESTKDAGALPLLSYLLDDMWTQMVMRGDGIMRLPAQGTALGSVLVQRANKFMSDHSKFEGQVRRIFTIKLAAIREDGEPIRRRALRTEFSEGEWKLVSELADHPNRLLVTATTEGGETYAEVAQEAIFRHWEKLREWIAAEREFLAWRSGLEAARRFWQAAPGASKNDALLLGLAQSQAQSWLAKRTADIQSVDRDFILLSGKVAQQRRRRMQALFGALAFVIIVGILGWLNSAYLLDRWRWFTVIRPYMMTQVRPHVLTADAERALKPNDSFRECASTCPQMVVVPAGAFLMGSPAPEQGRNDNEGPQHKIVIEKPYAVSKFEVTFDDWDACVAYGDCPDVSDSGYGHGNRPVINVSWEDAQRYVAWLSNATGKSYRLLSESEWEYAARAGTSSRFSFGDDESSLGQYAWYVANSGNNTKAVGLKQPNVFGLYDMLGNVYEWVADCYAMNYDGAPTDGSARTSGDCSRRVIRGGSWADNPFSLRTANRSWSSTAGRESRIGFRVGRTLVTP